MKTFFQSYTTQSQIRAKQIQLEKSTGLKWDGYSARGGANFTPVITRETPVNEEAGKMIFPVLTQEYQTFVKLAELTNLPLAEVLAGVKYLVTACQAVPTVNRMGNTAFVRAKQVWEK